MLFFNDSDNNSYGLLQWQTEVDLAMILQVSVIHSS
jgi:hypothetical protein